MADPKTAISDSQPTVRKLNILHENNYRLCMTADFISYNAFPGPVRVSLKLILLSL